MPATLSGQLQTWHKVTLDFTANRTFREEADTFRDHRLDVTFTNESTGETIRVPGFFAADGDAADSNATSGNVWRVNFNPPSEGEWTYEASFRTGNDIAASLNPSAGSALDFDGASGSFDVTPTDKTGDDFRAKGMLLQDEGTHYLQHQGDGDYFVRGGPGVPENLLATADFDGWRQGFSSDDDATPGAGDFARHDFSNHLSDYDGDGQTWDGGKGKAILGAINYLAEQGQNTIYVLTNTIDGDGKDVGPWAGDGIYSGGGLSNDQVSTYDVSKLAQWEILFDHMDAKGIYKNLLLQETENDQMLDGRTGVSGTSLSVERMVYMREMVARFGHNNGIQWNLGEENTNTNAQRADMSEWIKALDGYDHLVVVHSYPAQINQVYDPLLGVEAFDGTSLQTNANNVRDKTIEFRDKSEAAGDPWVLAWDEDSSGNAVIDSYSNNPDSANEKTLREAFWGSLTAGGSGGNWYIKGNGFGGHAFDQNLDDFKGFSSMWKWTAAATDFFNTYIPFHEMTDADNLTTNGGDFVMADPGQYYVIYLPYGRADEAKLNLNGHGGESFDVFWYNPREGGALISDGQIDGGGVRSIGAPPEDGGKDWVVFVRNTELPDRPASVAPDAPAPVTPPSAPVIAPPEAKDGYYLEENGIVKVQFEDIANGANPPAGWIFQNGSNGDNPGFEGDGYYYWKDEDSTALDRAANQGLITATVFIQDAGTYTLLLRSARDSNSPGDARNDIWVNIDGDTTDVLPAGSPPMVEKDGFVKLYGASTSWGFSKRFDDKGTDRNPLSEVVLDEGFHTITFAGRSQGYHIDSFQLSKSGDPNNSLESSKFVTGDAPTPPPPPPPPPPPVPEPEPEPGPSGGSEFSINSGGAASGAFAADAGFSGGSIYETDANIANTSSEAVYQSERYGDFKYSVAVEDGAYDVTLKFAEIYFGSTGTRVFDVKAEGLLVLDDFDVFEFTGGKNVARDTTIKIDVSDGRLDLDFVSIFNNAKLSGIEIAAAEEAAPEPPAGFTAPFDTSGDAFDFGTVKLYGFGLDGGAAPLEVSGGKIGVGGEGLAAEIDFRSGAGGSETIGFDFGAAVEAITIRLASMADVGGAKEAGLVSTYDAAGDLMETFLLKDGAEFDLSFDAPVRYATLEASDWVDGAKDPNWDPDISLVAIDADYIL